MALFIRFFLGLEINSQKVVLFCSVKLNLRVQNCPNTGSLSKMDTNNGTLFKIGTINGVSF